MVFSLFAACHRLYDGSSLVSEEDLIDLGIHMCHTVIHFTNYLLSFVVS